MPLSHQGFRSTAVSTVTSDVGVYILCDLDGVPMYVGSGTSESQKGMRDRVQRHLTSARSDIIANRQVDIWEIAYVQTYSIDAQHVLHLESHLYHLYNAQRPLMNGKIPPILPHPNFLIPNPIITQVMDSNEIINRQEIRNRLRRQANHYTSLVNHIIEVKESNELKRSLQAHLERLQRYQWQYLNH